MFVKQIRSRLQNVMLQSGLRLVLEHWVGTMELDLNSGSVLPDETGLTDFVWLEVCWTLAKGMLVAFLNIGSLASNG